MLIVDKMQFIDILKLINLCFIAFFYMEYNKKVASLVASLEEEKKNVARLVASSSEAEVASLEEEKKTVAEENPVASLEEEVASLEEEVASLEEEEKDVNTWYTIEDGLSRYKGEWKNGLPNGKGIKHIYKTDSYIEGNFVDSFAHGYCKQTFEQTWEKTAPYYEGEFKRNQWDGKGAYYYGDGDYYKGMWKNSKYNGQGASYLKGLDKTWVGEFCNDEKIEGNWVKGEI